MRIFISWSGLHAKAVAAALHGWINDVFDAAEPFMSDVDIAGGTRGLNRIEEELVGARFGIVVTTRENQNAPWINFEAGALSKVVDEAGQRVMPILVDLTSNDLTSPLKQFQAAPLSRDGIQRLVKSLAEVLGVEESYSARRFETYWPQLEDSLKGIETPPVVSTPQPTRDVPEVVDEILTLVRSISRSLDEEQRVTVGEAFHRPGESARAATARVALGRALRVGHAPAADPSEAIRPGNTYAAIMDLAERLKLEVRHVGPPPHNGVGVQNVLLESGSTEADALLMEEAALQYLKLPLMVAVEQPPLPGEQEPGRA